MPFTQHAQFQSLKSDLQAVTGATDEQMNMVAPKLTFTQILQLLWQFGSQFGPQLFAALVSIITDIQNGTITNPTVLEGLIQLYGPALYAMAVVVSGWFGITLPPISGLPTPPPGTQFVAKPFAIAH